MIKTNTKQVKEAIKKMIIENAIDWIEDNREYFKECPRRARYAGINPENPADFPDLCRLIDTQFYIEKVQFDNRLKAGKITRQELFTDWAQGLASAIPTNYWTYQENPVDILGDILKQTKEEREKYTEEESALLLTRLIYREIEANKTK